MTQEITQRHSNGKLGLGSNSQATKPYVINNTFCKAEQRVLVPYLPKSPGSYFISLKYWMYLSNIYSPAFRLL